MGLSIAIAIHLSIFGSYYLVETPPGGGTADDPVRLMKYSDLGPPRPMSNANMPPCRRDGAYGKTDVGVPVPSRCGGERGPGDQTQSK